ncbi:double-strand break repair protein MRE11 [Tanacetum coccineum]
MILLAFGSVIDFANNKSEVKVMAYSDSGWAKCPMTSRFVSGYCVFVNGCLVSWERKKQATLSRSSTEAEYRAMASATCKIMWILKVLKDLGFDKLTHVALCCDNKPAIQIDANPVMHEKTKHFDIDVHLVREKFASGLIIIEKVDLKNQMADILTKALGSAQHTSLTKKLGMGSKRDDNSNTVRVLVATDCHLGYMEKDEVRRHDSFQAFEEICKIADEKKVDFVLLGGDLFHENKPSRTTLVKAIEILRKYCLNDKPVQFQVILFNVGLPVFSIHGNHDDPAGVDNLSAVDILSACNLVNYFGKMVLGGSGVGEITLYPILIKKGITSVALYGLGNIRDERLNRMFQTPHAVQWMHPEPQEDCQVCSTFLVLHQNSDGESTTLHYDIPADDVQSIPFDDDAKDTRAEYMNEELRNRSHNKEPLSKQPYVPFHMHTRSGDYQPLDKQPEDKLVQVNAKVDSLLDSRDTAVVDETADKQVLDEKTIKMIKVEQEESGRDVIRRKKMRRICTTSRRWLQPWQVLCGAPAFADLSLATLQQYAAIVLQHCNGSSIASIISFV